MRLVFSFDFASPFAYLAATQVDALAARTGATLVWRPILLGGLFRELGGADVPLFTMPPPKRALIEADLARWAAWWGVPLRWPTTFPLRTVLPLRATLAHPDPVPFARRVFHAAWGEGRDVGDPAVLRDWEFASPALVPLLTISEATRGEAQQMLDVNAALGK